LGLVTVFVQHPSYAVTVTQFVSRKWICVRLTSKIVICDAVDSGGSRVCRTLLYDTIRYDRRV